MAKSISNHRHTSRRNARTSDPHIHLDVKQFPSPNEWYYPYYSLIFYCLLTMLVSLFKHSVSCTPRFLRQTKWPFGTTNLPRDGGSHIMAQTHRPPTSRAHGFAMLRAPAAAEDDPLLQIAFKCMLPAPCHRCLPLPQCICSGEEAYIIVPRLKARTRAA
jgi:hypothetical protein